MDVLCTRSDRESATEREREREREGEETERAKTYVLDRGC